jgi:choline dehydrogenase
VRYDVVVVGGGTAGCVMAARLSENRDRRVCLLEAGPDYGPLAAGRWPADVLDARTVAADHLWPPADDGRTYGGRVLGGSSAVNACLVALGSRDDYDEWGADWSYERLEPYLHRAREMLRAGTANTDDPGALHRAFVDAAQELGFPLLADANAQDEPVGVAPYPANVVDGTRWSAALAYLDPCRDRANLTIRPDTLVDRVLVRDGRAVSVVDAAGQLYEADEVVLSAGAYFSPAILMRSGIGPADDLVRLEIPLIADLPVGRRLLDHCGTTVAWAVSPELDAETAVRARENRLFESHAVLKAASRDCPPGSWDLHVLSWITAASADGPCEAAAIVFHMKPRSQGHVALRSSDPLDLPLVERGFLTDETDLDAIVEGIELARRLATTTALGGVLREERRPGDVPPDTYVRETIRNYFHPAGTCAIGEVVDSDCRVHGLHGLRVVDASVMPTIPRANTNLTTAAIAERIAETFAG